MIPLKSKREMEAIGCCGDIIAALFQELEPRIRPGVTTANLDDFVSTFILSHEGATPAFKGLYGFPGSACISINEEIVHGIPSRRRLQEGDIVSIDVGVRKDDWLADSAYTFAVGAISPKVAFLMEVTREALTQAVAATRPGNRVGDIGAAVVDTVGDTGLAIIRDLVGHGVGKDVHEKPQVPNFGLAGVGVELQVGMVLAIEPMLSMGSKHIKTLDDGWTVITKDSSISAHFEHTVAVTEAGPLVLTGGGIWDTSKAPTREHRTTTTVPG